MPKIVVNDIVPTIPRVVDLVRYLIKAPDIRIKHIIFLRKNRPAFRCFEVNFIQFKVDNVGRGQMQGA